MAAKILWLVGELGVHPSSTTSGLRSRICSLALTAPSMVPATKRSFCAPTRLERPSRKRLLSSAIRTRMAETRPFAGPEPTGTGMDIATLDNGGTPDYLV